MSKIQLHFRVAASLILGGALLSVQTQAAVGSDAAENPRAGLLSRNTALFKQSPSPSEADKICPPACEEALALTGSDTACTCRCSVNEMKLFCEDFCDDCTVGGTYCAKTSVFVEFVRKDDAFVYGNSYLSVEQYGSESSFSDLKYSEAVDYDNGGAKSCTVALNGDQCKSCSLEPTRVLVDQSECTEAPTTSPSVSMIPSTSASPSDGSVPSTFPSESPSMDPTVSKVPSTMPSTTPSMDPTVSKMPSATPSASPSAVPTSTPSAVPSSAPSVTSMPSSSTKEPTTAPSIYPVFSPSMMPSSVPTVCGQYIYECSMSFGLLDTVGPIVDCSNFVGLSTYDLCLQPDVEFSDPLAFLGTSADAITCVELSSAMPKLKSAKIVV